MYVDCDSCPGQHLAPPACPSCVVRLLLEQPAPARTAGPRADLVPAPEARSVAVDLVRTIDDHGEALDARERRAVALLTSRGLLAAPGDRLGDHGGRTAATGPRSRRSRARTATA